MNIARSIALVSMLAFTGAAYAQAPAAAPAAPAAPAKPAMPAAPAAAPAAPAAPAAAGKKPRSEKSLECSKQADTQNLHGKPRKAFMSKCKKG